ncbi:hypothetical protein MPER_14737, partial [Moniliophthora perniciosa FA553]
MLSGIRNASIASKADGALEKTGFKDKPLSLQALLYLATLGGAEVCDLDSEIGSFAPGKTFDALVVD